MNRKRAENMYGLACCERSALITQTDVKLSEGTFFLCPTPRCNRSDQATESIQGLTVLTQEYKPI